MTIGRAALACAAAPGDRRECPARDRNARLVSFEAVFERQHTERTRLLLRRFDACAQSAAARQIDGRDLPARRTNARPSRPTTPRARRASSPFAAPRRGSPPPRTHSTSTRARSARKARARRRAEIEICRIRSSKCVNRRTVRSRRASGALLSSDKADPALARETRFRRARPARSARIRNGRARYRRASLTPPPPVRSNAISASAPA